MLRWTCLLLLFWSSLPAQAGHKPPKILFRIFVQTTGEGQSPLGTAHIAVPPNNEQILIRALPEVTERELIAVDQLAGGTLRFRFNHEGRIHLDAATAENETRLLVVTIDGIVIYAPIIDAHLTAGELLVPHPQPAEVVQLLQAVAAENVRENNRP